MPLDALVFVIALASGVGSGLFGVGGAIIFVPLALFLPRSLSGQSLTAMDVAALSSLVVVWASLVGGLIHRRRGHVLPRLVFSVGLPMLLGALVGAVLSKLASPIATITGFALFATIATLILASTARRGGSEDVVTVVDGRQTAKVGLVVGLGAGFVGAGGAFALVPGLMRYGGVAARVAIGSSLWISLIGVAAGVVVRFATGQMPAGLVPTTVIGAALGSVLGAQVSGKVSTTSLRSGLLIILVAVSLRMWMEVVTNLASTGA
jgi:uncharacterized protein